MKKSPEELAALGWVPCDPPRVVLGFRWPHKEIIKCQDCNGKGWLWCYDQGYGKAFGQCYKKRCRCRGGAHRETHLDKEFTTAITWFKSSQPPAQAFEFLEFRDVYKVVDDPAAYWGWLRTEIATDNIYRLEAIRGDIVKLYQKFSLQEEDF